MISTRSLADRFSECSLPEDGAERSLAADFFQVHIFQDAAPEVHQEITSQQGRGPDNLPLNANGYISVHVMHVYMSAMITTTTIAN